MTAYEIVTKAYMHYMGRHLRSDGTSPKEYIIRSLATVLDEYFIESAGSTEISLVYECPANKKLCNTRQLQSIDVKDGYCLCYHDGHTGDWRLYWYPNRAEAKTAYKSLYMRYFRRQNWFWILKT